MDKYKVIKYPLSTEKSVRLMETDNKLVFVVDNDATKTEIKESVEKLFNVKVLKVNTYRNLKGLKKAYVKLDSKNPAINVATDMGLM